MNALRLSVLTLLAATGCGHAFQLEPPSGFVVLEEADDGYAQRATSARGVVLAVREIENEPRGDLGFWEEAIQNQVRLLGGYALTDEEDVTAGSGERGRRLRFGRDEQGKPYIYWITLFVTDDHIFVIEAGGRKERFEEAQSEVEAALSSFQAS